MYLWKTNELAEDLKNNLVEENDFFQYVLVSTIYVFLILEIVSYSDPNPVNQTSLLKSGIAFFITIIGTYHCYRINSEGDDKRFVERFVALCVPLLIKFFVLTILAGIILGVVIGLVFRSEVYVEYSIQVIEVLAALLSYWRLYVHMKFVSH